MRSRCRRRCRRSWLGKAMARELVHRLQTMRRSAGFEVVDQIVSYLVGEGAPAEALAAFEDYVKQETLSKEVLTSAPPPGGLCRDPQARRSGEVVLGVVKVELVGELKSGDPGSGSRFDSEEPRTKVGGIFWFHTCPSTRSM